MNPSNIMKAMELKGRFERNHPKVVSFFQKEVFSGIPEGTVVEITITKPGQEPVTSNMKVTADDLEMVDTLKNLGV
jgi:hypothetical protein